jgi:hypothetical protein
LNFAGVVQLSAIRARTLVLYMYPGALLLLLPSVLQRGSDR